MKKLFAITAIVALTATACSEDQVSVEVSTTAAEVDQTTSAPDETTTSTPATTSVASTTIAATTTAIAVALPAVTILRVEAGAGSGELAITVDRKPEGWSRFKVSFKTPNASSVRANVLDVRDTSNGVTITAFSSDYTGGSPLTIAVSWANAAGSTSDIAYATCNDGIPSSGAC